MPPMDEKKKVIADVNTDRRHAIDAAIVRIMKVRPRRLDAAGLGRVG